MPTRKLDADNLRTMNTSARLSVGNDDSLKFFVPSSLQRRARAALGAESLRLLAVRPLLPADAAAKAQELADDALLSQLARLRIRPEKKKRARDDLERLEMHVLHSSLDERCLFDSLQSEAAAIDHVVEAPRSEPELQAACEAEAALRRGTVRAYVRQHIKDMKLTAVRVGDGVEIHVRGVAVRRHFEARHTQLLPRPHHCAARPSSRIAPGVELASKICECLPK